MSKKKSKKKNAKSLLVTANLKLMKHRKPDQTYAHIAKGAKVPFSFVVSLMCGRSSGPIVARHEKLYAYLSKKKLSIKA